VTVDQYAAEGRHPDHGVAMERGTNHDVHPRRTNSAAGVDVRHHESGHHGTGDTGDDDPSPAASASGARQGLVIRRWVPAHLPFSLPDPSCGPSGGSVTIG
jgi:hypothetical protein